MVFDVWCLLVFDVPCSMRQGGATDVVVLLEPFWSDIVAPDRWGNTSFHLAAAACDYEVLRFLARRSNLDIGLVGQGWGGRGTTW